MTADQASMRFALVCFALAACTHDVRVNFPSAPDEPTSSVVVLFSQPASDVTIALNGVLVVNGAHTQRVVIDRAPVGTDDLVIAANGGDKEVKVWVAGDHATTIPVGMPDGSLGFVKTLMGTLITIVVYSLLH